MWEETSILNLKICWCWFVSLLALYRHTCLKNGVFYKLKGWHLLIASCIKWFTICNFSSIRTHYFFPRQSICIFITQSCCCLKHSACGWWTHSFHIFKKFVFVCVMFNHILKIKIQRRQYNTKNSSLSRNLLFVKCCFQFSSYKNEKCP